MHLSFCPFCMLCFQHSVESFAFSLREWMKSGLVQPGCFHCGVFVLICRRRSQQGAWLTETTRSEDPQHQNMKVYRSHEYSSWGSSASTHHLHPPHLPFFFPVSLIPLLHSPLFTRTFHLSLLRSCHPITLFLSFSLSLCNFPPWCNWRGEYVSLAGCFFVIFPSFICLSSYPEITCQIYQNRHSC